MPRQHHTPSFRRQVLTALRPAALRRTPGAFLQSQRLYSGIVCGWNHRKPAGPGRQPAHGPVPRATPYGPSAAGVRR